jgi:NTE family protein
MTKRLGLALGGGAALGWAHIGVLQVLDDNNIRPDVVTGTSIGSLVGACYVAGEMEALEKIARGMNWHRMIRLADIQVGKNGFLAGEPVVSMLREYLGHRKIEDLDLPFAAVAADLVSGDEVVFRNGDIVDAIRASISIPGVFTPVRDGGRLLVDGGLVNTVPISVCRELGADVVIGVNIVGDFEGQAAAAGLLPGPVGAADVEPESAKTGKRAAFAQFSRSVARHFRRDEKEPGFLGVALTSGALVLREIARGHAATSPADIYIEPKVGHITQIEFDKADELIALGRRSIEMRLPEIKDLLEQD